MDSLRIAEQGTQDWRSQTPGTMHACGHDGHTAMLLGAAKLLAAEPPRGEVRFIFQHAEELAPGGARGTGAARFMEGGDFVYGCPLWGPLPYGTVAAQPGPFMAAADFFRLTL